MSSDAAISAALTEAKEHEKNYEWLEAARTYQEAMRSGPETVPPAETSERIGFCYSLASNQAGDPKEFKQLRQLSVEAYKAAAELFGKKKDAKNRGKSAQCSLLAGYIDAWLASTPSEKRKILDECCAFGKRSLEAYKGVGDELSYGTVCNDMMSCVLERMYVASDWREMKTLSQEGITCADKAIATLSKLGDRNELLRAYFTASLQGWYIANFSEQEEKARKDLVQKSLTYSERALALSREVSNPYYSAMSNWAASLCALVFTEKVDAALQCAEEMLKQGTLVRDNYLKGIAFYVLTFITDWMMLREADSDRRKEGYKKNIKYAEDAINCLKLVSQDFHIAETCLFYAEACSSLGTDVEASGEERRALLEKAVQVGRTGLEHARRSGSPDATLSTLHALSKALHRYSASEAEKDDKVRLLEEAAGHREEFDKVVETAFPSNDWISGVNKSYEGLIKLDMVKAETDSDKKKVLLQNAVSEMDTGVSRCRRWILSRPVPSQIAAVAAYEDSFGGMLNELYLLAKDKKTLNRAVEVYEEAAKDFMKVSLPSRAAESYWKMARSQDLLGQHHMAAESFDDAFAQYKAAAQNTPHFADFYLDHATYMKAWSEIERAIASHEHEKYADAMQHYERIGNLLKETKFWSYLSPNFKAWAILEQAEDLSRKENSAESLEAFKKAADLFKQAKEAIDEQIGKIQNVDEKEQAVELSKASERRRDYCSARSAVEEARIADRSGDHVESAEKYESAAASLERILEMETDRKDIEPVAYMCRAWQKMKLADSRVSPELYHEASELFLRVKEHSTRDRTTLLACGNSAFCNALEYGTKFEATREKDDFSRAKQFLESAANYYSRAGFDSASVWTGATEVLFDAYNYMISAELDADPETKMKTYLLAEKCLERSAALYETAGYIGKKEEVFKTLTKVREKREFALSLGEVLAAPNEASSTRMISAPAMTIEEPVGLSKFEHAFVQANLVAHQKDIVVGESFGLEIQLANLGKDTAFLIKVEDVIPEGFDVLEKPERCAVNDGLVSLKGRKLAPLETQEMKFTLRPKKKGKFSLTPRIQFMDEAGEYKSCELEQVTVNVKELGIRGWLKGLG